VLGARPKGEAPAIPGALAGPPAPAPEGAGPFSFQPNIRKSAKKNKSEKVIIVKKRGN
jgi:hypothetical protein